MTRTIAYDTGCKGAVVTSITDVQNSTTTSIQFNDADFWRPTETDYPDGGKTTVSYADSPNAFTVASTVLVSGSNNHQATTALDGLGRLIKSTDNSTGANVDAIYNAVGMAWCVSNPYTGTYSGPACGQPGYAGDTYSYDAVGRVRTATHADSGVATIYYGSDVAANGGRSSPICASGTPFPTMSVDEAGKKRQAWTDGLGQLVEVSEPDPSTGSLTSGSPYGTCYSYNTLGKLSSVTQGSQSRTYAYDMLSRLTSVKTPEFNQNATAFTYDANGNVLTRVAPKPNQTGTATVTTTYSYDSLNRLISKSYDDGTPTASFYYDESSVTLPIGNSSVSVYNTAGRMSHFTTTSGGTVQSMGIYSYYPIGRVQDFWQCTPVDCATVTNGTIAATYYAYDLAGDLTDYYPPMFDHLSYAYDNAQRITAVTQNNASWIDSKRPAALIPSISYTSFGAVDTLVNGCVPAGSCTSLQDKFSYNTRLQGTLLQVGTSASPSSAACDEYFYYNPSSDPTTCPSSEPGSGSANNGSVMRWFHWDAQTAGPNSGISVTTHYTYDNVNRLTAAMVPSHYTQAYNYDRYGNMACASGSYACNTGITFDASTNRINTSGYSYDAAGDLTRDGTGTGTHSFEWDAEQRMKTVDAGSTGTFVYNAMGQRTQKNIGGTSYYYYYDAFGNLAAVRNASAFVEKFIPGANAKYFWNGTAWETNYLHGNNLGSTQIVTRADFNPATNNFEEVRIFYPFGILRWQSGGSQDVRFASMRERDSETVSWQDSLDWTPNRTFGENMGRWFSPDHLAGDVTNPQSLNRYAYALNNPTNLVDPLGLCSEPPPQGKAWTPDCKHLHSIACTNLDCVFQYYGSQICHIGGLMGPCPPGINSTSFNIGLIISGNTIFDAMAGAPGTYITPAGQLQIDSSGRSSTSTTLGFGFNDQLWSQTWGFIDTKGGKAPATGYVQWQSWSPIPSAASSTPGDNVTVSGFISKLYGTISAVAVANELGAGGGRFVIGPYSDVRDDGITITTYSITLTATPIGYVPSVSTSSSFWPFP